MRAYLHRKEPVLNSEVQPPISKYACASADMFKGRGQSLHRSFALHVVTLRLGLGTRLHSDVLEMALTDLKILRIDCSHRKFD